MTSCWAVAGLLDEIARQPPAALEYPTMTPIFTPRRELGRTGFRATQLGIGDLADRNVPLAECVATLRRALDAGLNVIDTAPMYEAGYSEEIVGAALQGRRAGLFVIDKIDELAAPVLPHLGVTDCLHYTLTCDPDVTLLGLSFPNEQDAAYAAARAFQPLSPARLADIRQRATQAIAGKGNCWWNPPQ